MYYCDVLCNISAFTSVFIYLSIFSFLLFYHLSITEVLPILSFKTILCFTNFFFCFLYLYYIYFCSNFYYKLPYTVGFVCSPFAISLRYNARLSEFFLVSWGGPIMSYTFLLVPLFWASSQVWYVILLFSFFYFLFFNVSFGPLFLLWPNLVTQ